MPCPNSDSLLPGGRLPNVEIGHVHNSSPCSPRSPCLCYLEFQLRASYVLVSSVQQVSGSVLKGGTKIHLSRHRKTVIVTRRLQPVPGWQVGSILNNYNIASQSGYGSNLTGRELEYVWVFHAVAEARCSSCCCTSNAFVFQGPHTDHSHDGYPQARNETATYLGCLPATSWMVRFMSWAQRICDAENEDPRWM